MLMWDTETRQCGKQDSPAESLPPELLGHAFSYLPLRDAVVASHVSRYWRAAALGTPQVWATIRKTCTKPSDMEFVKIMLSRSGSIADVSVKCNYHPPGYLPTWGWDIGDDDDDDDDDSDFDVMIRPYLPNIRSLNWHSRVPTLSLCDAAPFLQRLCLTKECYIPRDLLAGGLGALSIFRCGIAHLPVACPALSSVVELRIDDLRISPADATPRLFDLCPLLETLYVGGLRKEDSYLLLSGPPPVSLQAITLDSADPACNLLRHFKALRTPNVHTFTLRFEKSGRSGLDPFSEAFLRGAIALSIREPAFGPRGSWFIATLPDEREHSMVLPELCVSALAKRTVACGLETVRTLDITIDLLEHFVAVVAAVPALERITIRLETLEGSVPGPPRHPDTRLVGWRALEYIEPVLDAAPELQELVIDALVSRVVAGAAMTVNDAEFIVSHLEFLDGRLEPVPDITVLGFHAGIVRQLDLDELPVHFDTEGIRGAESVLFDTERILGGTDYWPFRVAYKD